MVTKNKKEVTENKSGALTHSDFLSELDHNNKNIIPVTQQLMLLAAILLLLFGGTLTPKIISFFKSSEDIIPAAPMEADQQSSQMQTPSIKPFTEISIAGEAAFVWDVQTQRALYTKNASKQLPLASVTKLMTALVTSELLGKQSKVTITDTAVRQDGDSGLLKGEIFGRETLNDLVLMSSSNDGAYAMAAAAGALIKKNDAANTFVRAMNIRAKELGLKNTYYRNPTGLDISSEEGGGYGSAKDMAFLMEYLAIQEPDLLTATREDSTRIYSNDGIYHDANNTNYYVDKIPGLLGSKTGYTDLAGGNLIIAFDAGLNRPIIVAVLGSTRQERFTDVMTLVKEAQKYVAQN